MKESFYDLVVVGSSFSSTFFLQKYLSKAKSTVKVLVLERGFLYPHAERVKAERGEDSPYAKLNENPLHTFENKNPEKDWRFQTAFGGSSNCWVGCTPRFMPADFRMKSLYGIADDWPIQYEELEPYYTEVEEIMSISGPDDMPFPRKGPYPQPPHLFTTVDKVLKKQYGNLYVNQPTARARQPVNSRGMCCVSSTCQLCPVNAKFNIENSNMKVYEDKRVELVFGAQVYSMDLSQDRVKKLYFKKDGKEQQVAGEVFALGANPIFNSHILLNSGDANTFTGKGIGEQLGMLATVHLRDLPNVGGSTYVTANGYMLYDGDHRKDYAACLIESSNAPYFRLEKDKWRNIVNFRLIFEELPDVQNHVATTSDIMKPAVLYKGASAYTLKAIEKAKEKLPSLLSALPVEDIFYKEPFTTESHILGATRMSNTPDNGVVDKNLIHHQYRNLFVLGSGSFTTFTPSNPTLTLSALSLHAADQSF
jgi:choline dehydrogenase-like flavoprotein